MAKVMVSIPDDVLAAIDIEAQRRGTSRSALLRELAEESMHQRSIRRAKRMTEISKLAGGAIAHGGNVADVVKANRPER